MGKTLYLECYSGISGDMTVAALLALGASEERVRNVLSRLPLEGYEIEVGKVNKCGVEAWDFDVRLTGEESHEEHHHHEGPCHEGHYHHEGHCHEEHHHHEGHHHHGAHHHRSWRDIELMLDEADLDPSVLKFSKRMFQVVADAEGKVHGKPAKEVHFHEVGAIDSIVDIVSTAVCLADLEVDRILVSQIWEGRGHVKCQHGILPVPAPAVLQIVASNGLPLRQTEQEGEMVTPTGAAIAALADAFEPKNFTVTRMGIGAGKKDFPRANILRAMLIEEEPEGELWMLESNLDDCTGEIMGYTMERLMEAGARDVFFTPVYMKKNRPAYKLSILCDQEKIREMDEILFRETTTIGVRRYQVERDVLERQIEEIQTPYGPAQVKVCDFLGEKLSYPEYESVKEIAKKQGLSYKEVYRVIKDLADGRG